MKTNPNDSVQATTQTQYINQSDSMPTTGLFGGLTKREYFAAIAMQGLMSLENKGSYNSEKEAFDTLAEYAVSQADALILELNKEAK